MGNVPYVGFATHRRATVRIHLYFKRLMIKQMICIKKKKNGSSQLMLCPFSLGCVVNELVNYQDL
jgi:hypothetical protein